MESERNTKQFLTYQVAKSSDVHGFYTVCKVTKMWPGVRKKQQQFLRYRAAESSDVHGFYVLNLVSNKNVAASLIYISDAH